AGRTLLTPPLVDNVLGTNDPAPAQLAITPTGFTGVCQGKTLNFLATGGTGMYNAALAVSSGNPTVTVSGATITVTFAAMPPAAAVAGQTFNVNVSSGAQQQQIPIRCN
ncbi:MAG: hypothetical protein ABJB78_06445, partial [Betaproteobacteria bacterium]